MGRTVIDCVASWAAVNLLYSDRSFSGLFSLNLTRNLEKELALLKCSVLTPNRILSLKLNPSQWEVVVKKVVNDDTEIESVLLVFIRLPAPGMAFSKLHVFLGFSQLPASPPQSQYSTLLTLCLFSWLNYQDGHLTLGSTTGLDLAIVYVSIQFCKEKLGTCKQMDSTVSSWMHHISLHSDYKNSYLVLRTSCKSGIMLSTLHTTI